MHVSIDVDGETMANYLGAINTSMGSCSEDIKARMKRAQDEISESAHMASLVKTCILGMVPGKRRRGQGHPWKKT